MGLACQARTGMKLHAPEAIYRSQGLEFQARTRFPGLSVQWEEAAAAARHHSPL